MPATTVALLNNPRVATYLPDRHAHHRFDAVARSRADRMARRREIAGRLGRMVVDRFRWLPAVTGAQSR